MEKIKFSDARYIKLGRGGHKEKECFDRGVMCLGFHVFPDFGNLPRKQIRAAAQERGKELLRQEFYKKQGKATAKANQVADFYLCGADTLWITFSKGYLWWCFAHPEVEYFGSDAKRFPDASRERKTVNGWHKKSIGGKPLVMEFLSGRLTRTAAYQETICAIKPDVREYLTHIINDKPLPYVEKAKKRRADIWKSIIKLMQSLHPKTFELLVDLTFSRSGWRRIGVIGGSQKTVDIVLELPGAGDNAETVAVQVKSDTTKSEFNKFIEDCKDRPESEIFWVYHTGPELTVSDTSCKKITVINAERLAKMVLNAGLVDWLIEKSEFKSL